jgi:hypothetical protein
MATTESTAVRIDLGSKSTSREEPLKVSRSNGSGAEMLRGPEPELHTRAAARQAEAAERRGSSAEVTMAGRAT